MEEEDNDYDHFNWEFKPPYRKFLWAVIRETGWYIVAVLVVLFYSWPNISKFFSRWKKEKDNKDYDIKYKKDTELASDLMVRTLEARQRMEERYYKEVEENKKKERERKENLERKRQEEALTEQHQDLSQTDTVLPKLRKSKSKFKPDYNPLAGDSGGRYIPPKRTCCSKGGCG